MWWLKYQPIPMTMTESKWWERGKGGKVGMREETSATGHIKANICLIQSVSRAGGFCVQQGLQKGDMKEGN